MSKRKGFIYDIAVTALFVSIIILCSFVTVLVGSVPITLQTFGVLCAAGVLGVGRGVVAVTAYILLGAVGLPIFSGFQGGVGVLLGSTGGYILGFLLMPIIVGVILKGKKSSIIRLIVSFVLGTLACYNAGVLWQVFIYNSGKGVSAVFMTTVVPFIIPDAVKILAAAVVVKRVQKYIR